jgi:diaminopimelate decarboxylase
MAAAAPFPDTSGPEPRVAGRSLRELAGELGTPFFLLSEARLCENHRALRRGLGVAGEATLRYCAKTNHEAAVLRVLAAEGCHLLACHAAEVALARRCGFPPERIAFARPVLDAAELDAVLAAGVGLFHVHRLDDLPLLEAAARRAGRPLRLSFRLRARKGPLAGLSPLARVGRRLGLSRDDFVAAARRAAASGRLEPFAVYFYVGTQQTSAARFERALRGLFEDLARLAREGVSLEEVDLGGGLPAPALRRVGPRQLLARWRDRPGPAAGPERLEAFAARVARRFRELAEAAGLPSPPALAAQPGRSLVGDAVLLVSRVRAVEGRWAFLDASRNHLPESPLLFSRRIVHLPENGRRPGAERFYDLSGSTLNTLDVLDVHRRLPELAPGDLLAFCDAGAYSISRAARYAGVSPPVWALGEDGAPRLARRAETLEDLAAPMEAG